VAKFQDFYKEEKERIIRLTFHSEVGIRIALGVRIRRSLADTWSTVFHWKEMRKWSANTLARMNGQWN